MKTPFNLAQGKKRPFDLLISPLRYLDIIAAATLTRLSRMVVTSAVLYMLYATYKLF